MNPTLNYLLLLQRKPILIKHAAGLMDFSVTNGKNLLWVFPDGTRSNESRPAKTVTAGVTRVFCDDWSAPNLELNDNSTNSNFLGSLADLQGKLTYYIRLRDCSLVTGSLADLQGKLTYLLDLYNCSLVTGSLADLQGKLTSYLTLYNCSLVTGVYTPSGAGTPSIINLSYTGLSSSDIDNTLIAIASAATPKNGGTFTATGMTRTAASDAAVTTLTSAPRNWTITGITKV